MLFNFDEAIKLRNHYFPLLIGQPFGKDSSLKVAGIMITKAEELQERIRQYLTGGLNDLLPLIPVTDTKEKKYKIYVIAIHGGTVYHSELDKKIEELGIEKIF